jgi:colanic acid biosynthesis glycosyl transferase WcaI
LKILISACYFTPDPIGGGKFTGEMAEWLAAHGHQVRAVVAAPFYPQWKIAEGYSSSRYKREIVRGVDVMRCPIYVPSKQGGLARLLQLLLFAIASGPVMLAWAWRWKPDVVWTMEPPLAGTPAALLAARIAGARSWLHVQDFEIDAAFELGILKAPRLKRFFLGTERRLMSSFDVVSSITPRMMSQLDEKHVNARKILFKNWADLDLIHPLPTPTPLRAELGISDQSFVALYSGNLGEKQGVNDLVGVARIMAEWPNFTMIICGDGVGRARLATMSEGLGNILFLPVQPNEKFNALLNVADVHLLPQRQEVADLVMPSKLPGMLGSGRPVIVGARPGTQLAQEVESCGLVVPPGDPVAMAGAICDLMADSKCHAALGSEAVARARAHWSKEIILEEFARDLEALARKTA